MPICIAPPLGRHTATAFDQFRLARLKDTNRVVVYHWLNAENFLKSGKAGPVANR